MWADRSLSQLWFCKAAWKSPYCLRGQPDSHETAAQAWRVSSSQPDLPRKLCLFWILRWLTDSGTVFRAETGDFQAPLGGPEMQTEAHLSPSHPRVSAWKAGRCIMSEVSRQTLLSAHTAQARESDPNLKRKETGANWKPGCQACILLFVSLQAPGKNRVFFTQHLCLF